MPPATPVALGARLSVPKAMAIVRSSVSALGRAISTSVAVCPPCVNRTAERRPVAVRSTPGPLSARWN